MQVLYSGLLQGFPGIRHGTATLADQPLTFRGEKPGDVQKARQHFLQRLRIPLDSLTLARQVHGTKVRIVDEVDRGRGAKHPGSYLAAADALLTQRPGITLGVFTADCIPILLYDPRTGWVGTIHAGWKGVVRGIIPTTLKVLRKHDVDLKNLRVWLGPCICARCYSTKDILRVKAFEKILGVRLRPDGEGAYHIDLQKSTVTQFVRSGVLAKHIDTSAVCTKTSKFLPSARRQGPTHPNTLSVISRDDLAGDVRGKDVLVFGLGRLGGGVASAQYAVAQHAHVTVIDAQSVKTLQESVQKIRSLPVRLLLGYPQAKRLPRADIIIANPGVSPKHPALQQAKKSGTRVTNDLALFREASTNPLVAVTGTKGKTTVATWVAHVLGKRSVLAGNLQRSPLGVAQAFDGKTPVVLEVSSFQLEHCDVPLRAQLSIITNLYPDHLNRHGTMRAYARIKAQLYAEADGPIIVPIDSAWERYAPKATTKKVFWTSLHPHPRANAWLDQGWIMLRVGEKTIRVVKITQIKNGDLATQRNAVTVALAGKLLGLSLPAIRRGLRTFRGVAQRFEVVRVYKKRTFVNSTTATNPVSAALAVQSIPGSTVAIVGGMNKDLPMVALGKVLQQKRVTAILLAGSASTALRRYLPKTIVTVDSMAQAVRLAWKISKPGDSIILAPGAASFGMFKNEFDRGEQYIRSVKALR